MKQEEKDEKRRAISKGAASGATAIIFAIIGFQAAVVVTRLAEPRQEAGPQAVVRDSTQPAYRTHNRSEPESGTAYSFAEPRRNSRKPENAGRPASARPAGRKVESFRFDPNTVSLEELVRLGLSERQARTILNYREKGGKFRCREDFRKMYTVSDSLYGRLEKFIEIPKVELNAADSAGLVTLKGIGPYFAKRILEYRNALGGFYDITQLLEVRGMDSLRFEGLKESVCVDTGLIMKFPLDSIPEEDLSKHPYIGKNAAKAICRLRGIEAITDSILLKESILDSSTIDRVKNYLLFQKK